MFKATIPNASQLIEKHGSPLYVYDKAYLRARSQYLMRQSSPFGLIVRYAVKANPHPAIIRLFASTGLHFDASSSYEVDDLLKQNIAGNHISLSSQQPPHNLERLLLSGVKFVATSLYQLECFTAIAPRGSTVGLRVNTGTGAGHNNRTTTAGVSASFGLWHEYLEQALKYAKKHGIIIDRLHTHIGSGADPKVWRQAIKTSLEIAKRMPEVTTLDIGGGYKVRRWSDETETDMQRVIETFNEELFDFKRETKRGLRLEIEPGTWLVAHAGSLMTKIVDIVDTGKEGYTFLRTDTGLNDFMRPALYGAQHEIQVLNNASTYTDYVVVGHNCESGDILTPEQGNPEHIEPRTLRTSVIGDLLLIKDVGAYSAAMRAKGYNAFPSAKEVLI
ncbi:MAG TPA: diaminopimelate decarboxylase [Candidatus Saccharimonadales bacterium]